MKNINTSSFDIAYPEIFSSELISFGDVILRNPEAEFLLQQPQVVIALGKLSELKEIEDINIAEDASTEDLIHAYYAIKRYNIVESHNELITLQGRTCYLQKAISCVTAEEQDVDICHLFATVIIDDTYFLDITGDCECPVRDQYEPIFLQIINDVQLKGNYQEYYDKHEQELQERLDKIDKILEDAQPSVLRFDNEKHNNQNMEKTIDIPAFKIPVDDKQLFEVGDYSFELAEGETEFTISDFSKSFNAKIHHIPKKDKKLKSAVKDKLLSDYIEHIGFDFQLKGIFNNYLPTGSFEFEQGKTNAPLFLHIYCRGFEYSLDYFGRVELKDGWLGLEGILKPGYADTPLFKVRVYCKVDAEKLEWQNYRFNYTEALQAKPEDVRFLHIEKPDFVELPPEILAFKELKSLTIVGNYNYIDPQNSYSPLNEIPESISDLIKLESLHISNTCITTLPDSIGELICLNSIILVNNKLKLLPTSLFNMPLLKTFYLDRNQLKELPTDINLPMLEYLSLDQNQLSSLPEKLVSQEKLKRLSIKKNCFKDLPTETIHIKDIQLELSEKQRLLDFEYKGADGKGAMIWNNDIFYAQHDKQLLAQLQNALKATVLEKHQTALQEIALKAVCLETTQADDYSVRGNTRFGGLPDLPKGMTYPEFESSYYKKMCGWQFIAQINCAELVDFQDYLPRSGIIYFFLEDQESFNCKVIYAEDNNLQSAKDLVLDDDYIGDDGGIYAPFTAVASNMISLPSFYNGDPVFDGTSLAEFEDSDDIDTYYEIHDDLVKKLGVKGIYQEWNDCFYPDRHHAINTYVFTQHESPQEQAAMVKRGKFEDWVILLKVHSDNNCGFCFWDAGEISFVIHKSDLAKQDFSNVMCTLETS